MSEVITTAIAQPFSLSDANYTATVLDSGTQTTVSNASDAAALPQAVINVTSTTGFDTAGTFNVVTDSGVATITYTAKTGTTFTGCAGGTGTIYENAVVTGWRIVEFQPSGTTWYRMFLAPTSAGGTTQAEPKEFIRYCDSVIGGTPNLWSLAMRSNGRVRATYTGSNVATLTGAATITWTASSVIRTLLGFAGTITCLAAATQDAVNHPTHMILSAWREAPQGWRGETVGDAISEMDDGRVDYLGGTFQKMKRSFSLRGHPYTPTAATALSAGQGYGSLVTAMYPDEVYDSKWLTPSLAPVGAALPWSIHQFVATSKGYELGYTLGRFQELVAASDTYFDEGYWSKKAIESTVNITFPPWDQLNDRTELELTKTARTVIT